MNPETRYSGSDRLWLAMVVIGIADVAYRVWVIRGAGRCSESLGHLFWKLVDESECGLGEALLFCPLEARTWPDVSINVMP